jgi:hypothetical protein
MKAKQQHKPVIVQTKRKPKSDRTVTDSEESEPVVP